MAATSHTAARKPWYSSRWFRIVIVIVAAVSVIITFGIIIGFFIWNSKPEKVLLDALDHSLHQPGMYHIVSKTADINVWNDGRLTSADGIIDGVPMQAVSSANMLYVKSSNPSELFAKVAPGTSFGSAQAVVDRLIATLENKWIAIDLQRQTISSRALTAVQCVIDAKATLAKNQSVSRELAGVYAKNPFLAITTTQTTDADITHDISIDSATEKRFATQLKQQRFAQTLGSCQQLEAVLPVSSGRATVTISKPHHTLRKLTAKDMSGNATTITTDYGPVPKISIPKETTDISQVSGQIFSSMIQSYLQGR